MFISITVFMKKMWISWASMFHSIPNGDPYVAFIVLFFLIAGLVILSMNITWRFRAKKSMFRNKTQIEMIYKVMNLY